MERKGKKHRKEQAQLKNSKCIKNKESMIKTGDREKELADKVTQKAIGSKLRSKRSLNKVRKYI